MAVDIQTQLFQDTASELENIINKNPEVGDRPDLMDTFVKEKGLDPQEFYAAYKEFDDAKQAGETDFRSQVLDVDELEFGDSTTANVGEAIANTLISSAESIVNPSQRFVGRVIGETLEGLEDAYRYVTPDELEQKIDAIASEATDAVLPTEVKKQILRYLDPYHGEGTLGVVENIGGKIGSFFVPFSLLGKVAKGVKYTDKATDFLSKAMTKGTAQKVAKGADIGLRAATAQTFVEGTDRENSILLNSAYDEIMNDEDAVKALEKLQENPEDNDSETYLTNFLTNLGIEGTVLGAFLLATKGTNRFLKTASGKKLTQLGKRFIGKNFSSRMGTDDKTLELLAERNFASQKALAEADGLASDLTKSLDTNDLVGMTAKGKEEFRENVVNKALAGGKKEMNRLSPETQTLVTQMRNNLDKLSSHLEKGVYKGKMKAKVGKKKGVYLTRSYRFFEDPKTKKKITKAVNSYLNPSNLKELRKIRGKDRDAIIKEKLSDTEYLSHEAYELLKRNNPKLNEDELSDMLLEFISDKGLSTPFFKTVTTKTASGTVKAGKKRRPVPNEIKALWGEIKDPSKNYMTTYAKIAEHKAEADFIVGIKNHLLSKEIAEQGGVATTRREALNTFGKNYKKFDDVATERAKAVFDKGAAIKYLDDPAIKDLYISDGYAKAVRLLFDEPNLPDNALGKMLNFWATSKGITQAGKTIYNPATHGRNTMGNMALMVANGMLPFAAKNSKAWDATWARIGDKTNQELGEYIGKMIGYGLADSSVTLGIIRKNLGRDPTTVLSKLASNKVARLYEGEDFLFKAMHFEKSLNYLKKAFPKKSIDEVERMAAQRTRDLMPNYNLLPKFVKLLRYSPVADFAGFAAEMARVSKNLVKYTFDDVLSGNKELQKQAAIRLGGMTSAALLPTIAQEESAAIFGIDSETQESLNNIDKKYYTNTDKIYLSPITTNSRGRKQVERIMLGGIDPFHSIKIAAQAAHQGLLGEDMNPEIVSRTAFAALDASLGPLLGTSMLTDVALKMWNGEDWQAYNKNTAVGTAMNAMATAFDLDSPAMRYASMAGQVFEPGFASWLQKRWDFEEKINEKGEAYSDFYTPLPTAIGQLKTGNDFLDMTIKDVGSLIGITPSTQDISGSIRQNLGEPLREIKDADKRFIGDISIPNLKPEDYNDIYLKYINSQGTRRDGYQYLRGMLEYYNQLGFTPEDYRKGFTKTDFDSGFTNEKMSQIQNALGNRFRPSYIPNNVIGKVQQQTGGQFNFGPIFQMQRELDGSAIED